MQGQYLSAAGRILTCLTIVLWPTLTAAHASAGEERYKWWHSDQVRAEVGLTADQSQDLEAIFQSFLPRMRADKEELERQEKVLSQLMREATVDEAGIVQAIDRVETARGRASKTRTLMLYRMYRVLTPDQRLKLEAAHERLRQERRERGSSR